MIVEIRNSQQKVVRTSQNLRPILNHHRIAKVPIANVTIFPNSLGRPGGNLLVVWKNGDNCRTVFADFKVLREWVKRPLFDGKVTQLMNN